MGRRNQRMNPQAVRRREIFRILSYMAHERRLALEDAWVGFYNDAMDHIEQFKIWHARLEYRRLKGPAK